MSPVLVTGAASFSGRHLLAALAGCEIVATDVAAGSGVRPLDVRDPAAVRQVVREVAPRWIIHLAGLLSDDAAESFAVNLGGTRHVVEACDGLEPRPAVLVVSSAAVYGLTRPEESPVRECTPLRPVTAYGASKAAAEIAALALHRRGVARVKVARPFNLVGPGLRPGFAPSDFMAQALAARRAGGGEIRVGNLEPRRDFVDVRDAVRAYRLLLEADGGWGECFNVATGAPVAVRELLAGVIEAAGAGAAVVEDPARRRAVDVPEQVGDATALRALTGWRPEVPLAASLRDMAAA